jgi:GntR family histidine utilization transcriptional repressor
LNETATLHQRIRGEIEDLIRSGTWAPGRKVPSEAELMARFGCSRMTVNKAMSQLAQVGLIDRRRRAGSFVARPRVHSTVLDIPDIQAQILARGETYRFDLLDQRRRKARAGDAEEAALAAGGALLALRGLHVAGGQLVALEDRLVSLAAAPCALDRGREPHQRRRDDAASDPLARLSRDRRSSIIFMLTQLY